MIPNNIFILSYSTGEYDTFAEHVVPFPFDGTAEELRVVIENMLREFSSKMRKGYTLESNRKNANLSDALAFVSHGHVLNPAMFSDFCHDVISIDTIDIKTIEQWIGSYKENPDIPYGSE